jgi:hypothetical protein
VAQSTDQKVGGSSPSERAQVTGRLWDIDTGHDLMITEPRAVADALLEVAAG